MQGPPASGLDGELGPLATGRVDFVSDDFSRLIDSQGSRFAWARAIRCPCRPPNRQATGPAVSCPRCRATPGWTFFGPRDYVVPASAGELDALQVAIVAQYGSAVISGLFSSSARRDEPFTHLGPWEFGEGFVSVRPENALGYYDRLVDLDSERVHTEVLEVCWTTGRVSKPLPLAARYPVIALNHALDQDSNLYSIGQGLALSDQGVLEFTPGAAPKAGTQFAVHYLCHRHWRVMKEPHSSRQTRVLTDVLAPETPAGTPTAYAIQAFVQLEHLTDEP